MLFLCASWGGDAAVVPSIWPLEIANVLAIAARKNRITTARRQQFLTLLQNAPITVDASSIKGVFGSITALADQHRLTLYDASYLELAMRRGLPLATLDGDMQKAAGAAGVRLL